MQLNNNNNYSKYYSITDDHHDINQKGYPEEGEEYLAAENGSNINTLNTKEASAVIITNRKFHDGNWTIYLVVALISSIIVFLPFSFNRPLMEAREIQPIGPCFMIHLVSSAIISFACLWNVFHTPSHGEIYKNIHRWVGRIGLFASLFGVIFGFLTTWIERKVELGQKIGLSMLGVGQLYWTMQSYVTIRMKRLLVIGAPGDDGSSSTSKNYREKEKEIIATHREAVLILWVFCLAPAWARVPQILGASSGSPLMFISFLLTLTFIPGVDSAMRRGNFWY